MSLLFSSDPLTIFLVHSYFPFFSIILSPVLYFCLVLYFSWLLLSFFLSLICVTSWLLVFYQSTCHSSYAVFCPLSILTYFLSFVSHYLLNIFSFLSPFPSFRSLSPNFPLKSLFRPWLVLSPLPIFFFPFSYFLPSLMSEARAC